MEKELISVIIPVYNCEKYLEKCVESIINQDYQNYELILVDDGSIDMSGTICDNYSKKYKNIKVIHKKNTGVSDSRNKGINIAEGKYLYFLDSDDYLDNGFFADAIKEFNNNPKLEFLNYGYYSEVYNNKLEVISSDILNYKHHYYKNEKDLRKDLVELWDKRMLYNVWNKVYVKDIIVRNNLKFPEFNWGEDMWFNREYMSKITNFINSDKVFYHYIRERAGAVTKEYKENFFNIRKEEYDEFNKYFEKNKINFDDYIEFSSRRFIESILGCIENIYLSKFSIRKKFKMIKNIVNDEKVIEAINYTKAKSKKIKIMLIPIKYKLVLTTMLMGKLLYLFKKYLPGLFNHLKNNR